MATTVHVQVDFYVTIQKVFGTKTARVALDAPATVAHLLAAICETPAQRDKILDSQGGVRRGVTVLCNGRNIAFLGGLDAVLRSGDVVAVFPPMTGG